MPQHKGPPTHSELLAGKTRGRCKQFILLPKVVLIVKMKLTAFVVIPDFQPDSSNDIPYSCKRALLRAFFSGNWVDYQFFDKRL